MPEIVIKKDGSKEPFDEDKVRRSLTRVNLPKEKQEEILSLIQKNLPQVVTTKKLFQYIFSLLKKPEKIKYNLKKAIFLLGPAGYPFEHFIAHLLRKDGFETKTNVFLQGKCVTHEIDVLAIKESQYFIEAKFHQREGKKNDIKTVLYIYGRAIDLFDKYQFIPWIFTNTKFTQEAIKFALCRNIKLTSWNFPEDESLSVLIEKLKCYPITILTSLNQRDFQILIKNDIILIEDLLKKDPRFLFKILARKDVEEILEEAKLLIQ